MIKRGQPAHRQNKGKKKEKKRKNRPLHAAIHLRYLLNIPQICHKQDFRPSLLSLFSLLVFLSLFFFFFWSIWSNDATNYQSQITGLFFISFTVFVSLIFFCSSFSWECLWRHKAVFSIGDTSISLCLNCTNTFTFCLRTSKLSLE